jgi:TPR repeat protein
VRKWPGADEAGLKKDPAEAVKWFQNAADAGDAAGLFFLAGAYRDGEGVPQDKKRAFELYERGASRGDWEAAQAISHLYAAGEGVEQSRDLSDQWMRKAIELKHRSVRR